MVEFLSILSTTLGAATTATKFVAQLSGVKDETGTVVNQVERINKDIIEARRLRYNKELKLMERETSRIDGVIKDTENAVLKIAQHVESSRVGVAASGTVKLYDRFDWVLRRSAAVVASQQNLQTCHQSLLGEISHLRQKEAAAAVVSTSHMPPPYEDVVRDGADASIRRKTSPNVTATTYKHSGKDEDSKPYPYLLNVLLQAKSLQTCQWERWTFLTN